MMTRLAFVAAASVWSVGVSADEVRITLAGERLTEQLPFYTVSVGDTVVADGGVEGAMASGGGRHIFAMGDVSAYTKVLNLPLPDGVLDSDAPVVITLTNAAYDTAAKTGTMLQILSVAVNGAAADLTQARAADGSDTGFFLSGDTVVINGDVPVEFPAPAEGWPEAAPVAAAATAPVEASATCSVDTSLVITGFDNGANGLNPASEAALDELAGQLDGQTCTIEVIGYSSLAGPAASNQALSERRAEAVLQYLGLRSVTISNASATGAGETDRFGAPADNRRVVVTVSP